MSRISVRIIPSEGQSEEEVQAEIDRSIQFATDRLDRGVQEYRLKFRRIGPFKVGGYKEVGPPPWPWPKVVGGVRPSPLFVSLGAGWRSTLYSVHMMYRRGEE